MALTFDVMADSMVEMDGEEIPAGEARRRVCRLWGSKRSEIVSLPGAVRIVNLEGPGEVTLSIVPPKGRGTPDLKAINQGRKRERLSAPDFQDMARMTWRASGRKAV